MVKYRVIRAYVFVWLAMCLSYAGVRAALRAMLGMVEASREPTEAESVMQPVVEPEVVTEAATGQAEPEVVTEAATGQAEPEVVADAPTGQVEPEAVTDATTGQAEPEDSAVPVSADDSAVQPEPDTSDAFEDAEYDESINDGEALVEDGTSAQQTEVLDIPSLSEYLSWYICGSCRHNCSLANPRCHNGSRLAELKVQEYYELYCQ